MLNGNGETAPAVTNGAWRTWPNRAAAMAEARRLVEGTTVPQGEIAFRIGISTRTLSDWRREGNWTRPAGAPEAPDVGPAADGQQRAQERRERLLQRLFRVFDRHLMDIESRAASANGNTEEKDARALGTLARTLGTLIALERDDGAPADDPEAEAVDPDEIRARIARRLFSFHREGDT